MKVVTTTRIRLMLASAIMLLSACATTEPEEITNTFDAAQALSLAMGNAYPATLERLTTTEGKSYLQNLDARIESLEQIVGDSPMTAHATALAVNLYHRYRILGKVADAERALDVIAQAVAAHPNNASARQVHAAILVGFHRFDQALGELEAISNGRASRSSRILETEINLALGRYDQVSELFDRRLKPVTNFHESVLLGNLGIMHGDLSGASMQFLRAQQIYSDSSPFQLAWLYTQQGIALLRFGDFAAARPFFEAALQRVPDYYLAAEHLAECEFELGELDAARARYQSVIEQTEHPEFIGALAAVEAEAGNATRALQLQAEATAAWEALLMRHRAAFADHAAGFYLETDQAAKALELTRYNLEIRRDVLSLLLHAEAAEANSLADQACSTLEEAVATGLKPPEMREAASIAERCKITLL